MKKKMFLFASLLFFLTGCSYDDLNSTDQMLSKKSDMHTVRWYGTKKEDMPSTRGVADQSKLWNASVPIDVKFLNSPQDATLIEKIKTYAKEWEEYAGITFNFVSDSEKAVVRIGFDWKGNDFLTWSYTGNEARAVFSQNEPTAVFGGIEYLSEVELKGDVLRVFGQILGLEYEQRHLSWDDSWWKKDRNGDYYAQSYWETMFEGYDFDWTLIRQFVFDPMTERNSIQTQELDMESIMLWPYYTRVELQDRSKLVANYELSEMDKTFINKLYPLSERPILLVEAEPCHFRFRSCSDEPEDILVDWGDGKKVTYHYNNGLYSGTCDIYPSEDWVNSFEKRTLKFYGNAKQITALECEGVIRDDRIEISKVDKLNLSNLTELKYLDVSHLSFSKLEVLNHKKIESLHGGASYFDEFSVSNCDNLNQITMLSSYRIKNLNIKKCHNLYDVTIYLWIDQEMPNDELLYCNHLFSECNSLSRILLHLTLYSNNIEIQTKTDLKIEHCSSIERLMYQNLGLEKIEMVGDFRNLIEVELSNNLLTTVDIPESSNLYRVDLSHNPLENDEESLRKIVGLLPDKTNEPNYPGEVIFREEKKTLITSWIGDILSSKNWNMQFYE